MHLGIKFACAASFALAVFSGPIPAVQGQASPNAEQEKQRVLEKLNVAAANFRSTSADFEFDTIDTDPIYDKDVQTGKVYYQRNGSSFKMGAHFTEHNGKPSARAYTFVDGSFKLFEAGTDSVTTYAKAGKWESYAILGFGASGKELESKWTITYLGSEMLADGKTPVKTEKLELVAKDPAVRKNIQKVTIWVDPDRAVSLKQVFTMSATNTRVCVYSNIKMNQALPDDAFKFKTDSKTTYQTQ
jgi:outer membrane lipoprotein-sorting protein